MLSMDQQAAAPSQGATAPATGGGMSQVRINLQRQYRQFEEQQDQQMPFQPPMGPSAQGPAAAGASADRNLVAENYRQLQQAQQHQPGLAGLMTGGQAASGPSAATG